MANAATYNEKFIHPFSDLEGWTLKIRTDKYSGALKTLASVCRIERENGYTVEHFGFPDDFLMCLIEERGKRATQKAIDTQHAQALAMLPAIKQYAANHYFARAENEGLKNAS